ncbi:discoidin domain-containing protein [Glycomyces buryatensis]|uniref:discoidin domain-containing protein n=1 Tax=Glycomyces buryatensis TaxID=2570927 RepID=UPI0014562EBD|nr:discoidin domain-containing protein [Glycomyces buryatensis]
MKVWLTDVSADQWVAKQRGISFQTGQTSNPLTINVDDGVQYQRVEGFGAAMTDSSAWLIDQLPASKRNQLMGKLFNPSTGIGLSLLRTPMGATDVNVGGNYSYDDMPPGEADPTLANFSIEHDVPYIIPALQQAQTLNPDIKIMANPWSPPGWMKTSDSMIGGTLKDEYYTTLADYFVKYIQAYSDAGIPISYVSPQNEPMGIPTWPGMFMNAYQETRLVEEIGRAFEANGISTKILAWDHNWDVPSYPETVFNDPVASQYAVGTGWHIYSGRPSHQTLTHNDYPHKEQFLTEATGGVWQADKQAGFEEALDTWVIGTMRNWGNGAMLWNIALDPDRGPLNSDTNGIGVMRGLVTIDPTNGLVSYNEDYYALAHASKFVQPGAHRIYSNSFGDGSIENVAFQNPDGSKALIVFNSGDTTETFSVADGTEYFEYTVGAGNALTFTWSGPTQHGSTPAATNVVDPTHDFTFEPASDPTTITYDPELLPLQNTVDNGSSFLTYSFPVGASIQAGTALDRSQWTVTASKHSDGNEAANAIDGDTGTRWSTGQRMKSGDWFQIDLGSSTSFSQIVLDNGEGDRSFDLIGRYQVYVSDDGVDWGSAIANGNGTMGKTAITLPPQTAQYVRIVNTEVRGSSAEFFFPWSIGEIDVYGSSSGSIAAPTAVSNGLQLQQWTSPDGAEVAIVYNGTGSRQSFAASPDGSYTYELPSGTSAMFTTKESSSFPAPAFGSMTPSEGIPGYKVTISGSDFGDKQGLGSVCFGSNHARIDSWSDTSITVYVPNGLPSGAVTVAVNGASGEPAGESSFTVTGLGTALPRTDWTATASDESPWPSDALDHMLDADIDTRYSSGTGQYNGMWMQVDMGQAQTFNKLVLDAGGSVGDYTRSADVFVSANGTDWTKVSTLTGDGEQAVQLTSFPTQAARYIKVVNTGSAGSWWSVAEFNVYN